MNTTKRKQDEKPQDKRQKDLKSKLVAATSMLLVATIMMVSTTYAWFTLSTAPEVTGINTAVGANGNLEMALLPTSGDTNDITSAAGDSAKAATLSNVTWGNLVDLSTYYGLEQISLMPAAVNLASYTETSGTYKLNTEGLLKTPSYGSDGRVSELVPNTVANAATAGTGGSMVFPVGSTTSYGVRGIGTASSMSDRQLAYRNYRAAASTAGTMASNMAQSALKNNGEVVAQMAVTHAVGTDKYYDSDVQALQAIVDAFLGTTSTDGALDYLEAGMKNSILAAIASKKTDDYLTGEDYSTAVAKDTAVNAYISSLANQTLAQIMTSEDTTLQSVITGLGISTMYSKYTDMLDKMNNAQTAINNLQKTTVEGSDEEYYAWGGATSGIRSVVGYFADPDKLTVNGYKTNELMSNLGNFATSAVNGINVEVPSGAGIFADIADFCGNYEAQITIRITYEDMNIEDAPFDATMYAKTNLSSPYLTVLSGAVNALGAPDAVTSADSNITDMYGYTIDLAFRTNASTGSKLQLQTEAVDRIYNTNTDDSVDTQGGGSTISFTGTSTSFGETQILGLMDAVNVVFYNPDSGEIYGIAKLDTGTTTVTPDEPAVIEEGDEDESVEEGTEGSGSSSATVTKNYSYDADTNTVTAKLYLMNFSVAEATSANSTAMANGDITFAGKKSDSSLLSLTTNTATKVSVMVYLDGNQVGNDDVANGAQSVTGSLNLQFSTDATLTPMEYTPLKTVSNSGT